MSPNPDQAGPTRWKLRVEYAGGAFVGWGIQPGQRTVQGEIERALSTFVDHPVRVEVSGRTDAGVSALGQICAFTTHARRPAKGMRDGVNALLPDDVAVLHAEPVPLDFNPRRHTKLKVYRYVWLVRPTRSPLRHGRVWHVKDELDVEAMHEAVQALAGTHDFQSFRASSCAVPTSVRTIPAWRVERAGDEVHLTVEGHGFLQHMIRIVAGSLYEVGRGRRPIGWMGEVLAGRDRTRAGRTAPASGLTLVRVSYEGESSPS